jgi:hypothetical protein
MSVFALLMLFGAIAYSQNDSLGMQGDNLDLSAVLSIFKQSSTVEDFEKRLNAADAKINNLDLNNDQQVDYLRVVDYGKDDFHSIVIQDPVSKSESQDVAVIEIQKKDDKTAHIQIVGDETLYGKNYIIEPKDQAPTKPEEKANTKGYEDDVYASPNSQTNGTQVMINVWAWPSINYIYSPGYSYWVSPWYWGYYPSWYSPWRPYGWSMYRNNFIGYNYGFYGYHSRRYAFPHVHNYYYGRRVSSGYVHKTSGTHGRRDGGQNKAGNATNRQRFSSGENHRANNGNNGKSNSENRVRNGGVNTQKQDNRARNDSRGSQMRNNGQRGSNASPQKGNRGGGGGRSSGSGGGHSGGGGHRK